LADLVHRPPSEHHVELREAEDERIALVDQRDRHLAGQLAAQPRRELETAEPGAQDHDANRHDQLVGSGTMRM
jgi:hypothetical protein